MPLLDLRLEPDPHCLSGLIANPFPGWRITRATRQIWKPDAPAFAIRDDAERIAKFADPIDFRLVHFTCPQGCKPCGPTWLGFRLLQCFDKRANGNALYLAAMHRDHCCNFSRLCKFVMASTVRFPINPTCVFIKRNDICDRQLRWQPTGKQALPELCSTRRSSFFFPQSVRTQIWR
jgi:hypothetical protein